jgi:ubiquitin-protein ligase
VKTFERDDCLKSIECHQWHYQYFMEAGSPVSAAVYERAIERVTHYMNNPPSAVYVPKKIYQPNIRGHYAPRKRA